MTDPANESRKARARQLKAALAGDADPALVARVQARRAAIDELVQHGRRRRYAMRVQQMLDRALESFIRRTFTQWDPTAAKMERDKANAETHRLIAAAKKGDGHPLIVMLVKANDESRATYDRMRKTAEKDMAGIAAALPVAAWIETVYGVGLPGLASILTETGTLDGYANPAKLWSRLGFAPFEGLALSTWKRESWRERALTKEEWIAHPFSGERYAHIFALAVALRNAQWIGKAKTEDGKGRPDGPYGEVYAARRAHCEITHPDWSDEHRDKDALRVMFKRFLADLWSAWIDSAFDLGHVVDDAQPPIAEVEAAAAGQARNDAHRTNAGGGFSSSGHERRDAHNERAGSAAAGHDDDDAHRADADGGSSSRKRRGQKINDPHRTVAAPPPPSAIHGLMPNARLPAADPSPGHENLDAQAVHAGSAAAGQATHDAHYPVAGGGSSSPGQPWLDAQKTHAGSAAAGHLRCDSHRGVASGGGSSSRKRRGQSQLDAQSVNAAPPPPPANSALMPRRLMPAADPSPEEGRHVD